MLCPLFLPPISLPPPICGLMTHMNSWVLRRWMKAHVIPFSVELLLSLLCISPLYFRKKKKVLLDIKMQKSASLKRNQMFQSFKVWFEPNHQLRSIWTSPTMFCRSSDLRKSETLKDWNCFMFLVSWKVFYSRCQKQKTNKILFSFNSGGHFFHQLKKNQSSCNHKLRSASVGGAEPPSSRSKGK